MNKILRPGENCTDIRGVSRPGLLVDGESYFRAFYHAALTARRYILLAGWQFDSTEPLLRDVDDLAPYRLVNFLDSLCRSRPELEVFILAWDFNMLFAKDHEWFQRFRFSFRVNERIRFRFDDAHAMGASHHQKIAVVDGRIGFVGGLDIAADRWDRRLHKTEDPGRIDHRGHPYEPYHDFQTKLEGEVVKELVDIFRKRWWNLELEELPIPLDDEAVFDPWEEGEGEEEKNREAMEACMLPLPEGSGVALSLTQARMLVPPVEPVYQIRQLYLDAIERAEKVIYIENQYFSSQAVYRALLDRMRDDRKPKLEIIMIFPHRPHSYLEEISLGIAQMNMFNSLLRTAEEEGHSLGIFYTVTHSEGDDPEPIPTYIHAKLLIVDDRFLNVGSANLTNRSMGLDTELNISWEEAEPSGEIEHVRLDLLREHTGLGEEDDREVLEPLEGLAGRLNSLASAGKEKGFRLKRHTLESFIGDLRLLEMFDPEEFSLDPEKPVIEETIYETLLLGERSWLRKWRDILCEFVMKKRRRGTAGG